MKSTDYLVKSISKDGKFRAYAVNASQLVEKAHEIHDTWSASSAALRTYTGIFKEAEVATGGKALTSSECRCSTGSDKTHFEESGRPVCYQIKL